jgi:hypothetical protein
VPEYASIAASTTAESRSALVASPGLAVSPQLLGCLSGCGTWRSAFTVAQLTCSCATNIPAPEMKIWSPSWRGLPAFGPAYGIQREDEDR